MQITETQAMKVPRGVWNVSLAVVLTMVLAGAAWAGPFQVDLTVREPSGVARKAASASGGIPLPRGLFGKEQEFAVFAGGREVPAQVIPLVVDERGFLRWVLVDVQTDVAANGMATFTLKAAKPSATTVSPVKVIEAADGVTVNTGKVTFTVAKGKAFSLFTRVVADSRPVVTGGEVSYTNGFDGKRYAAAAPTSVEVEYRGPMRATICVQGGFVGDDRTRLHYIARITAWTGRSDVHVKYALANSNAEQYTYRTIKDSSIRLTLADPAVREEVRSAKGSAAAQDWTLARGKTSAVFACDLYLNDDPPRRLAVTGSDLLLTGVAERAAGGPRMLFDCSHLSSQYVIDFAAPTDRGALAAMSRSAKGRLHIMAPPAWYSETESLAIGHFGTQTDEMKCYDTWAWTYDAKQAPQRPRGRSMPVRRYVRGEDNHYETEQDNVEALLLMYLRTGSRPFLTTGRAWANYEMDLQNWRTDGWRWKDGGVWWGNGPYGNRPKRKVDPVTGRRNSIPGARNAKAPWTSEMAREANFLANSKQCSCHNYGAGLVGWFCITGDRDALEAAVDSVEQVYNIQRATLGKEPGKVTRWDRAFARSCLQANALRMALPADPFVIEASGHLSRVFLERPGPEPRGFIPVAGPFDRRSLGRLTVQGLLEKCAGGEGVAEMRRRGVTVDSRTGELTDPKTGAKWYPLKDPQFYQYASLPRAIETYYRITGSEDAKDWLIALGQGFARVIFQRHGNFAHYREALLVDFPVKGVAKDRVSWTTPASNRWGEGIEISGYAASWWPDVPARAYALTGEALLKQRAYDYWFAASHRGYRASKMHNLGGVGQWINVTGVHSENVRYTGRTFYVHAHPRTDTVPPKAVGDLRVTVAGDKAIVTFTAPADQGGGKVTCYQVKCSDKPIVDYEGFLAAWAANTDATVTNWWLAVNLDGEGLPAAPATRERFDVTGLPADAKYFAVRSFDDSSNRSGLSNVAEAR